MRHHARFFALGLVAFVFAISAGFDRAQAQTPTPTPVQAGQVIISELRLRGPAGVEDEYIELYNNTDSPVTVQSIDGTPGWSVVLSTGQVTGTVFTITNGTVIPARGHLLGANVNGYSLCNYPSGTGDIGGTTAPAGPAAPCLLNGIGGTFTHTTPDRTWDFDVPDGAGIALFATTSGTNLTAATRLDAVGFTGSPAFYREGGGIPTVVGLNAEHAYYRDLRNGTPRDTGDNASDFLLVGTAPGLQVTRLGAPGPENLNSPTVNNSTINPSLLDTAVSSASPPNRERSAANDPLNPNDELGTLIIRRRITNNTGLTITRLRFRIVTLTTLGTPASECPAPSCADLRALTSEDEPAVATSQGPVFVRGVRLEQPPEQPAGGAYNSSLSVDSVTLLSPLPNGQSINVVFKLGVMRDGPYRFFMNIEAQSADFPEPIGGPVSSGAGSNGGTTFNKKKLIMDTVRTAPSADAAPAPRTVYVPLIINTAPRSAQPVRSADEEESEEDEEKEKEKEKEKKPEEGAQPPAQPAPLAPEASAPEAPAAADDAPQPAPAKKNDKASKQRPAAAKAASRGEQ